MIITLMVWSARILALAIIFQTIELLQMRSVWSESGVWRWSTLKKEFSKYPPALFRFFNFIFEEKKFDILLWVRIYAAVGVWIYPFPIFTGILFITTWLIAIRWRGIFNGGSDSMTALIALSLWIGQSFSQYAWVVKGAMAYIAVHITASYFIAGYVKLKNSEWRSGIVLPIFLNTPRYDSPPEWVKKIIEQPNLALLTSWTIIIFECLFPLAWVNSTLCFLMIGLALVFHLLNFWVFGLNRFVFAWMAGYPALVYWSMK